MLWFAFCVVILAETTVAGALNKPNFDALEFLAKTGYLHHAPDSVQQAVREYQDFHRLTVTGTLDQQTVESMKKPRCGIPDIIKAGSTISLVPEQSSEDPNAPQEYWAVDKNRFVHLSRWRGPVFGYKIHNYTPDLSKEQVDRTIARAFKLWESVTPLKFIPRDNEVLFHIKFGGVEGGPGGTLALGFFPPSGEIHFDAAEHWILEGKHNHGGGRDLFRVAAHEIGHALGLNHSRDPWSLMSPHYGNNQLMEDDIRGIQELWGYNPEGPHPTGAYEVNTDEAPRPPTGATYAPNAPHCTLTFDAIEQVHNNKIYAFKDQYIYEVKQNGGDPIQHRIRDLYNGGPSFVDAAVYVVPEGKLYLFSGSRYYRFSGFQLDRGYPKQLGDGFQNIDAAYTFRDDEIVVFKGKSFTSWTEAAQRWGDAGRSFNIKSYKPYFENMDSILRTRPDKIAYSFKGQQYLVFNEWNPNSTPSRWPKPMRPTWLNCNRPVIPVG